MQRVIGIVRKTLNYTVDAIDGAIIMTPDILEAINAIFDPKGWNMLGLALYESDRYENV